MINRLIATGCALALGVLPAFADPATLNGADIGRDPISRGLGFRDGPGGAIRMLTDSAGKATVGLLTGATSTTLANIAPVTTGAGVGMGIKYLGEEVHSAAPDGRVRNLFREGGAWYPIPVYTQHGFSKEFDSTYAQTAEAPAITLLDYAVNTGATNVDVTAGMDISNCAAANSVCFGRNTIVRTDPGGTNARLRGVEIDVQNTAGQAISSDLSGLLLNLINAGTNNVAGGGIGTAIQMNAHSGRWSNGFNINDTDVGIAGGTNAAGHSIGTLILTGSSNYVGIPAFNIPANTPIVIGNTQNIMFFGPGLGAGAKMYNTTADSFHVDIPSGGLFFMSQDDTTQKVAIGTDGSVILNNNTPITFAGSGGAAKIFQQTSNFLTLVSGSAGFVFTNQSGANEVSSDASGNVTATSVSAVLKLVPTTVSGLGPCNSGAMDQLRVATDLTATTFRATATGGGSSRAPVYCDGAAWTVH